MSGSSTGQGVCSEHRSVSPFIAACLLVVQESKAGKGASSSSSSSETAGESEDMLQLRALDLCAAVAVTSPDAFAAFDKSGT